MGQMSQFGPGQTVSKGFLKCVGRLSARPIPSCGDKRDGQRSHRSPQHESERELRHRANPGAQYVTAFRRPRAN